MAWVEGEEVVVGGVWDEGEELVVVAVGGVWVVGEEPQSNLQDRFITFTYSCTDCNTYCGQPTP